MDALNFLDVDPATLFLTSAPVNGRPERTDENNVTGGAGEMDLRASPTSAGSPGFPRLHGGRRTLEFPGSRDAF